MDRVGCVDIRALPLQLLLCRHRDWEGQPVVVVDRDKPQGIIQRANRSARDHRIATGMRYAAALSICRELRGGTISDVEIDEAVARIAHELWSFSPRIEPSRREQGVFWLDASGLRHLYSSLEAWAAAIQEHLREMGFHAVIAVGFSLFGSYAAAKAHSRNIVFQSREAEQAHVRQVPIAALGFEPELRETLRKLGIQALGGFIDLPAGGVRKRFGPVAEEWHRLARDAGWSPLQPCPQREPTEQAESLDYPEDNVDRLIFRIARLMLSLLAELKTRHEALKAVALTLTLDDRNVLHEEIVPATPTQDANHILPLVHLRLGALSLSSGVVGIKLEAVSAKAVEEQLGLFREAPRRRIEAAERALARIRAEMGNGAVICAQLEEGHLPEARFAWTPLGELAAPNATEVPMRPLVRRLYDPPRELPHRHPHDPDGWLIRGLADGPVEEVIGPQIISGGWWMRELTRAYYYVRTRSGRWLWIYYDQRRRRWFLQGEVQ